MRFLKNISKMFPPFVCYICMSKRRCPKLRLLFFVLIGVACTVYGCITYMKQPEYVFIHKDIHSQCILPDIDINDPTINKYYSWHPQPLECDPNPSLTLVDTAGYLRFNESIYKPSQKATLKCVYSVIKLVTDFNVIFETEIAFSGPVDVPADFFVVRCRNPSGKVIYENLHQKIVRKSNEKSKVIKEETDEDLSVFLFGIDSVSRLGAIRKLPKTVKYITETLGGYVLKGYNKVGDCTFPNLVPMLCGKSLEDMGINYEKEHSDRYPFIWYEFEKQGYVTMHSEDWPEVATFDLSVPAGFSKPPTTHYSRPLWLAMRKIQPMQYIIDQVFIYLESKAMKMKTSSGMCYGNRPNHVLVVDYLKKFVSAYKGKRKFAFAWLNELAHNYVTFLEYGDNDLMEQLKWLHMEGHMDRSVFILYSDHGSRQDDIRNTYVGRIEDRMPLFSIVLPEVLKKKYPEMDRNLKANEKKLTTVFNIHETLRDVLEKRYGDQQSEIRGSNRVPQSISILKRLPETQSCADAKIPESYCACYASQPINKTAPTVKTIANFLVQSIHEILLPVREKCARLSLNTIMEARSIENSLERKAEKETRFTLLNWILTPEQKDDRTYLVVIKTVPGNGTFESIVKLNDKGVLTILGEIFRTNRYGSQAACMDKRFFRAYCFCTV